MELWHKKDDDVFSSLIISPLGSFYDRREKKVSGYLFDVSPRDDVEVPPLESVVLLESLRAREPLAVSEGLRHG